MYKTLSDIIEDSQSGPQSNIKWNFIEPKNTTYQKHHQLDKALKYGRTIYIPYDRVIMISGNDIAASGEFD